MEVPANTYQLRHGFVIFTEVRLLEREKDGFTLL